MLYFKLEKRNKKLCFQRNHFFDDSIILESISFIIEMVCFFCVKLCKNMAYSKQKDSCFHEPFSLEKRV